MKHYIEFKGQRVHNVSNFLPKGFIKLNLVNEQGEVQTTIDCQPHLSASCYDDGLEVYDGHVIIAHRYLIEEARFLQLLKEDFTMKELLENCINVLLVAEQDEPIPNLKHTISHLEEGLRVLVYDLSNLEDIAFGNSVYGI